MKRFDDPRLCSLANWTVQGFFVVDHLHQHGLKSDGDALMEILREFHALMEAQHGMDYSVPWCRFMDAVMHPETRDRLPAMSWPDVPAGEH